jgi:hypothetical protein
MSSVPFLAGIASTTIFAASTLPMLVKAYRTRDLTSYSLGNILLANVGNAVHSVYVFSLPPGPLWVLHAFYLSTTAWMLVWFFRYGGRARVPRLGVLTHVAAAVDGWIARRGPGAATPSFVASTTQPAGGIR